MVFVKHNSLKSDIFSNPIFIPGFSRSRFSGSRFFRVQVFQGPGFSGPRFFRVQVFQGPGFSGSGSRVWVQVLEVAIFDIEKMFMYYILCRICSKLTIKKSEHVI